LIGEAGRRRNLIVSCRECDYFSNWRKTNFLFLFAITLLFHPLNVGPEKTEKIVHPMPRRAVNRGEFLFLWASHFPMAEKQQSIQDRQIRFQEE
jgi:hypothetical protein